ncbi:MAG TPA: hypothetical protein VML96_13265 [Egibacteraceae bacterium]|nr:hypothetical protein [Egibacteraceae bacterium]
MRAARAEADPQQLRDEEAEGLLGHFVKQRARLWRLIDETEALGSFRDVIAAHGKLSDVLKAEAQLLGQVGGVRTVNLYVTPEWVALRAALVQALAAHPEARQAVAAVLRRVEVPALEAGETR